MRAPVSCFSSILGRREKTRAVSCSAGINKAARADVHDKAEAARNLDELKADLGAFLKLKPA